MVLTTTAIIVIYKIHKRVKKMEIKLKLIEDMCKTIQESVVTKDILVHEE